MATANVPLSWADVNRAQSVTNCSPSYDLLTMGNVVEDAIRGELDMNGLSTAPVDVAGAGVGMLRLTAHNWLCRDIRVQQKHDGSIPNDVHEGTMSVSVSIDASIKHYDGLGREALDKYIRSLTGAELDQNDWYAGGLFLAGEDL